MKRYEYKIIVIHTRGATTLEKREDILNHLGEIGWQLVALTHRGGFAILIREKD
ncbi:DUF4177 domain-containing protein [Patescibacteria group bacterium AH-259-L07]|nr:DUF4177 domain-containing protein [Patescibacteria group bacterium AH-259-L07]